MGIIEKSKRILADNWDDFKPDFSNPAKDIRNALRQTERTFCELEHCAAVTLTKVKLKEKKVCDLQCEKESWVENAEKAVIAEKDELALKALAESKKYGSKIEVLLREIAEDKEKLEHFKKDIFIVGQRLQELRRTQALQVNNEILVRSGVRRSSIEVKNISQLEEQFRQMEKKSDLLLKAENSNTDLDEELLSLKQQLTVK